MQRKARRLLLLVAFSGAVWLQQRGRLTAGSVFRFFTRLRDDYDDAPLCGDTRWIEAAAEASRSYLSGGSGVQPILWDCSALLYCGGLGDRFRGIGTTAYVAALTHRAIFISIRKPSEMHKYLWPRSIMWNVSEIAKFDVPSAPNEAVAHFVRNELGSVAVPDDVVPLLSHSTPLRYTTTTALDNMGFKVVRDAARRGMSDELAESSSLRALHDSLDTIPLGRPIACAWHALFRPSPLLEEYIAEGLLDLARQSGLLRHRQSLASILDRDGMKELFKRYGDFGKPPIRLHEALALVFPVLDEEVIPRYVAVQIRISGSYGRSGMIWMDTGDQRTNTSFAADMASCAKHFAAAAGIPSPVKVLVASDSIEARQLAQKTDIMNTILLRITRRPQHVDRELHELPQAEPSDPDAHISSLTELIIFSMAELLVASQSGFSVLIGSLGFMDPSRVFHYDGEEDYQGCSSFVTIDAAELSLAKQRPAPEGSSGGVTVLSEEVGHA